MNETLADLTEKCLKIVLVGDSGAGKTSIAVKFCNDEFTRQYTPTAGVDFSMKNVSLGQYKNVTLHIWDVGGLALRGTMLDKYLYAADENENSRIKILYEVFMKDSPFFPDEDQPIMKTSPIICPTSINSIGTQYNMPITAGYHKPILNNQYHANIGTILACDKIVMLVYDVTNSSSFDVMEEWMNTVTDINKRSFNKRPLLVIVGNKCDMEHQRTVKRERSHRYAAEKGIIYHDMSARTGESVSLSIANLAARVLGVQLTRMDQDSHKPIVTAEIGDTVDISTIQRVIKRQPNRKTCQNNNYPSLPLSKSAVCSVQ